MTGLRDEVYHVISGQQHKNTVYFRTKEPDMQCCSTQTVNSRACYGVKICVSKAFVSLNPPLYKRCYGPGHVQDDLKSQESTHVTCIVSFCSMTQFEE